MNMFHTLDDADLTGYMGSVSKAYPMIFVFREQEILFGLDYLF